MDINFNSVCTMTFRVNMSLCSLLKKEELKQFKDFISNNKETCDIIEGHMIPFMPSDFKNLCQVKIHNLEFTEIDIGGLKLYSHEKAPTILWFCIKTSQLSVDDAKKIFTDWAKKIYECFGGKKLITNCSLILRTDNTHTEITLDTDDSE